MNIDHAKLESLAREICDSRNGAGHYDKAGTHKRHWRGLALDEIGRAQSLSDMERARGLNTLDALMAVFGMKRVG